MRRLVTVALLTAWSSSPALAVDDTANAPYLGKVYAVAHELGERPEGLPRRASA